VNAADQETRFRHFQSNLQSIELHIFVKSRKLISCETKGIDIGYSFLNQLKIGELVTTHNLILAPLAGISNHPFRRICREFGADLTFSEMISIDGLLYNNESTRRLMKVSDQEHPIGFQFFGNNPETFKKVIPQIESYNPDLIDLNFGCPVRKVVSRGAGAAILKDIDHLQKIVNIVKLSSKIPVTVKIRVGWDEKSIVVKDAALAAQEAGADALTVHARTRSQGYSGKADWRYIAQVKDILKIPVIGNGDVFDGKSALEMFRSTGVDGVMLARGVLGKPWLFQQILNFLKSGSISPEPTLKRRIQIIEKHYQLELNAYPQDIALSQMKKHFVWYTKGLPYVAKLRNQIYRAKSYEDIRNIFSEYQIRVDNQMRKGTVEAKVIHV
jgi:tRNA-dihydrouridine synthase B